jgi:peptide deformylase
MTVRTLRYLGDPLLRTPGEPVTQFDGSLASLITDLLDTVQEPGRAGLAACQIGSGLTAFSYFMDGHLGYLINPRIIEVSGDYDGPESCLSIPGIAAFRRRAGRAVVAGVNMDREPVCVSGTGELARVLQHEFDHLQGELFIDGLEQDERRRVMRQLNSGVQGSGRR